ncbi:manganese efflux pump [Alicyclobacillus cycloheptanicus]|uniref:Mn2+ efflux pump MntP n=1 Tax=Alicyclobacillus cycloheptanicus TaxID=1457 RepID=A0ABT9XJF9_9BACL|nr:manganese efflux pump [Alicyclobacillus cycloheptanicus]MDQ0190454.1 putative Mn2+ efflux pump MntP [Alicyclobacillus cycloheptanicus]WDM02693.1 manganese efflux pump [Alicyclobacillus cycloheptanicus]
MSWLSTVLTAILIGLGSNLDNCGTGMAYGSHNMKFPHWVNGIINAIGFCTALLGAYAGHVVSHYISTVEASWTACIVLSSIGLFFWYSQYIHPRISPRRENLRLLQPGWRQGFILGLGLSFTNLTVGFGATVSNLSTTWVIAASIGFWGYIMLWAGNVVGYRVLVKSLGRYSSFFAGLILILVGIHQVTG